MGDSQVYFKGERGHMKQRISTDQLQQLTPGQQDKLRSWWQPSYGDVYGCFTVDGEWLQAVICRESQVPMSDEFPLLSIGQMLQLIDPKEETIFTMMKYIAAEPQIYKVSVDGTEYFGDSMCDCLWQAVKEIL